MVLSFQGGPRGLPPLPNQSITPMTPTNGDGPNFFANPDDWAVASRFALAAVTSQGTMGGLLVAGFVRLGLIKTLYPGLEIPGSFSKYIITYVCVLCSF